MQIKLKIIMTLLFITSIVFSLQQGISLFNPQKKNLKFIKEHHRIKIKTADGKNIAGQFTILDSTSIIIKSQIIKLDQIVKIRKASGFSACLEPVLIGIGGAIIGSLTYNVLYKSGDHGYGVILAIPTALPALILPLTSHNNQKVKRWKYKIIIKENQNN